MNMNKTEKIFTLLINKPDELFSYKELMELSGLKYKQVTRVIQTLTEKKYIFKHISPNSGVGKGRGKIAYFGVSEVLYANKKTSDQ